MRIDAHVHGKHADRDASGKIVPPVRIAWEADDATPEEYVQAMREAGIDRVIVVDPPDIAFALQDLFGDFAIPAPHVVLDKDTPEDVDALFRRGAKAVKFISPARSYGDDAYHPIYDAVSANNGLAVFHTGYLVAGPFEPGGIVGRDFIVDICDMRPAAIDRVARAFPDLKILMSHFGNPWWEEAWKMISAHPNVYADFSGGTAYRRDMEMWRQTFAPNGKINEHEVSKLLFASDVGYFRDPAKTDFQKYIDFYEQFFDAVGASREIRDKVNYGNALELLGESG